MTADQWLRALDSVTKLLSSAFWPATVAFAVFLLRKEIRSLVPRLESAKAGPVETKFAPATNAQEIERLLPPIPSPPADSATQAPPPNLLFEPYETMAQESLKALAPDNLALQLAWAVRAYAESTVDRNMEVIYRLIFGSQIKCLRRLNQFGPLEVSALRQVYEDAKKMWPEPYSRFSFETWLNFFIHYGLTTISSDVNARVEITPLGRTFLMWMDERSVLQDKAL